MNKKAFIDEIHPGAAALAICGGVLGFVIAKQMSAGFVLTGVSVLACVVIGYILAVNIFER